MNPVLSICIPAYNGGPYVSQAIESALAQTFSDFELIIVDNASTDATFRIAKEYEQKDRRIRVFRNDSNIGSIRNFNRCVDLSKGDWIKFLCADDWLEPTCVEQMLARKQSGVLVMTCAENYVFEPEMPEPERKLHLEYWSDHCLFLSRRFPGRDFIPAEAFAGVMAEDPAFHCMTLNSAMVHRTAFDRFGRFDVKLLTLDDWEYFARVAVQTGLIHAPDAVANYRVHASSYGADVQRQHPFKMHVLSPLVIRYKVVHSPFYARVREAARRRGINLRRQLYQHARAARRSVETYARRRQPPDVHAVDDWKEMKAYCPRMPSAPLDHFLLKLRSKGKRWLRQTTATLWHG